jgi:hypothetical protein
MSFTECLLVTSRQVAEQSLDATSRNWAVAMMSRQVCRARAAQALFPPQVQKKRWGEFAHFASLRRSRSSGFRSRPNADLNQTRVFPELNRGSTSNLGG